LVPLHTAEIIKRQLKEHHTPENAEPKIYHNDFDDVCDMHGIISAGSCGCRGWSVMAREAQELLGKGIFMQ